MADDAERERTRLTRKASRDALCAVYLIIVGLALREAMNRTFLDGNDFVGGGLVDELHMPTTLLFFAFVPTAIRFAHGSAIHIYVPSPQRFKPIVDFVGFVIQGAVLYLMAVTLHAPEYFVGLFLLLLLVDSAWLVGLRFTGYRSVRKTVQQWLTSNAVLAGVLGYSLSGGVGISDSLVILGVTTLATAFDYVVNRDFYFPYAKPA